MELLLASVKDNPQGATSHSQHSFETSTDSEATTRTDIPISMDKQDTDTTDIPDRDESNPFGDDDPSNPFFDAEDMDVKKSSDLILVHDTEWKKSEQDDSGLKMNKRMLDRPDVEVLNDLLLSSDHYRPRHVLQRLHDSYPELIYQQALVLTKVRFCLASRCSGGRDGGGC